MASQYTEQKIQAVYAAYLGQPAGPAAQKAGAYLLEEDVFDFDELSSGLSYYEELRSGDDRPSDEAFVTTLYDELFERKPDEGGLAYWTEQLGSGALQRDELVPTMLRAAGPTDQEASFAKFSIADYYADNVSLGEFDKDQPLTLDNLRSNEQLYADLETLDEQRDTLDLAVAGESVEGRPLYRAEVGQGDKTLMIVSQQHGDEPLGTEALVTLLDTLSADTDYARNLRDEVTVVAMPRVNPDGFARWEQQAAGDQDVLDPRRNSENVDLNRSYDATDRPDPETIPEALAVLEVVEEYNPDLFLDYHHQNDYLGEDGELETMSVQWATNPGVDAQVSETGQRAAVAIANQLEDFDHAELSLFPGSGIPSIARNGLALEGTPTLLIEQRGLQEMDQIAQNGLDTDYSALASALTAEGLLSMLGVIESLADDSFEDLDPAQALAIPERGERIPFEEIYATGQRDSLLWANEGPLGSEQPMDADTVLAQLDSTIVKQNAGNENLSLVGIQDSPETPDYAIA
ncbi:M14 family zinc carboxypeptidase [Halomonas sp. M20]|uniref:M14 family zinc carboxypeptidase n=1 Tax=Halomonas sp. M20 TaxID=2763264 RepID=UPI001D0AFBEA|nr:M14 family zinc carboxypeptidase [Halomonas sp. M20]